MIKIIGADQESDPISMNLESDMSLSEFKSMILSYTEGKPFCLKHYLRNDQTISELVKRTREWNQIFRNYDSEVIEVSLERK